MKENIDIRRDENGVPHVEAENLMDLYWGQGYVHATDRGLQMLLMRILGQGRLCELIDDSDESLAIDVFFRKMNWCGHVKDAVNALPEDTQELVATRAAGTTRSTGATCAAS